MNTMGWKEILVMNIHGAGGGGKIQVDFWNFQLVYGLCFVVVKVIHLMFSF